MIDTSPTRGLRLAHWPQDAYLLAPIDLSDEAERVLAPAHAVAQRVGLGLTLFGWHWEFGTERALERNLRSLADSAGIEADVVTCWSDHSRAGDAIAQFADENEGAIVVMATHAYNGLGQLFHGSVAELVVQKSNRPVMLVGPRLEPDFSTWTGPVVVCLDGSALAEAAIPIAHHWADRLGVGIELVTVIDPEIVTTDQLDVLESGYLEQTAKTLPYPVSWDVLHGAHPPRAIAAHADSSASLVVVTTHGRTGWSRLATGSIATGIVNRCPTPVLMCPLAAES